jgi:hypothetical protein
MTAVQTSRTPISDLDALKRSLSKLFPKGSTRVSSPADDLKDDVKEPQQQVSERFLARPGDTLEVKGSDGRTWDIWQVLSSSDSNIGHVDARSLRTGAVTRVPSRLFELKKFAATSQLSVEQLPVRYFVPKQGEHGWEIKNVPIMACEARGTTLYDETYLDRLVQTYWSDKKSVVERHGPGSEVHPYEPPVIIGHTSDDPTVRNDQREAIGYITAMWRCGKLLMANIGNISDEWIQRLRRGVLPNRSCELKVQAGRIVALALLSEEPYFHLPQMRNFSADGGDTVFFRYQTQGEQSMPMEQMQQLVDCLKQAASIAESMMQNDGGGAPPAPNPSPSNELPPSKPQQYKGGEEPINTAGDTNSSGSGTQKPHVGEEPKDTPATNASGPTQTASSQSGPTGKQPNPTMKLSESEQHLHNRITILERQNQDMGEKLKFAVGTIGSLTTEKRRLAFRGRLETLLRQGAPLGGAEGIDRHLNVLVKMSDDEAEKHLKSLDELPKINMRHRHNAEAGGNPGTPFEQTLKRYASDYNEDPEKFTGSGYENAEVFAASQMLGELMSDGLDEGFSEEGEV